MVDKHFEREYPNADAAKLDVKQCALDHGYDVKAKATVVTCTRAGQPEVNVVDKDGGPGTRPFKTDCPFRCVLKKSGAGVKVVVVNGEHNHPIDLDIGRPVLVRLGAAGEGASQRAQGRR